MGNQVSNGGRSLESFQNMNWVEEVQGVITSVAPKGLSLRTKGRIDDGCVQMTNCMVMGREL